MTSQPWTTRDVGSQQGRLAVITGATGGLGFEVALALQRRAERAGSSVVSLAAHPGFARTGLLANGPGTRSSTPAPLQGRAAARYYGPTGLLEMKGPVGEASVARRARDTAAAARLWDRSQRLAGLDWPSMHA